MLTVPEVISVIRCESRIAREYLLIFKTRYRLEISIGICSKCLSDLYNVTLLCYATPKKM